MKTFYTIGFYVLLVAVVGMLCVFVKANPMKNQGAASWIDLYSADAPATLNFLETHFGIQAKSSNESAGNTGYTVVKASGQIWPFAGVMQIPSDNKKLVPHASIYLTVKDYDSKHAELIAAGAKPVIENLVAGGMKFGIYIIPGGLDIGIAQWIGK